MNKDIARPAAAIAIAIAIAGVVAGRLLRRMAADFQHDSRLRPSTTVLVYGAYVVQLAVVTELVRHPNFRVPIPPSPGRVLGGSLIGAGSAALVAGVGSFGSARQLSGTETGSLIETGVYRWTRNPQYLGYLAILAGASLAKRSLDATLATAASAAVFDHWIGHEEANLIRTFGTDYIHYRERTARWLRLPTSA